MYANQHKFTLNVMTQIGLKEKKIHNYTTNNQKKVALLY